MGIYQKFCYTAKEIFLKMSCADPETFVWRAGILLALQRFCHWNGISLAGRLWPNIKCWLRSFASFSGLRTSIAKEPYSIVISHGSAPFPLWKRAWMYSIPDNYTLIDDIPSMWHSSTNKSHVSNIYGSRGGEWGSGHPTYTDKHTHMRARVLARSQGCRFV